MFEKHKACKEDRQKGRSERQAMWREVHRARLIERGMNPDFVGCIVLPDSTPPVATTMFQNVTVEAVEVEVEKAIEHMQIAEAEAALKGIKLACPYMYVTDKDRKFLTRTGGEGMGELIEMFDRAAIDGDLGVGV